MKYLLIALSLTALTAFTFKPQLDSDIPQYTHPDAKSFCESLGKKLPSSREMAKFAMDHGAVGILEPSQYRNQSGYMAINRTTANYHAELDFYFNGDGYVSPEPDSQAPWLWTSSYGPHNIDFVYVFNLRTGEFDFDARIMKNGARCIE